MNRLAKYLSLAALAAFSLTASAQTLPKVAITDETEAQDDTLADVIPAFIDRLALTLDSIDRQDPIDFGYNPLFAPRIFRGYISLSDLAEQNRARGFSQASETNRRLHEMIYRTMVADPSQIEYAEWQLPVPPELPEEDHSFSAYIKRLHLPGVTTEGAYLPEPTFNKIHWLHVFDSSLQFSQAYISKNWYQGGNDYLALLFAFNWNVNLNTVYHPNLLFENQISYKLGMNSVSNDEYRKYGISEDLFQWNMRAGFKAFHRRWFYTLALQFKTQFFNNYPLNSPTRTTSFLSPGDLNVGIGMTYSYVRANNKLTFNASIAPLSYNLKTCIDKVIDPTQFGMQPGQKFHSEIGSSATLTLNWLITSDITLKSRLFAFTDFKNYYHDLENTINFSINRFLSTQIFVHLRYDTASDLSLSPKWHHWMLKEILSFGFAYHFQTKPNKK